MNGENNHIFHTSALDGAALQPQAMPPSAWNLFAVQLCVLAAFVGMSLIAIAARVLADAENGKLVAGPIMLALAGALMMLAAWRGAARRLRAAEHEVASNERQTRGGDHAPRISVNARPALAHARITGMTPTL